MKNRFLAGVAAVLVIAGLPLSGCSSQSAAVNDSDSTGYEAPSQSSTGSSYGEAEGATLDIPDENPAERKIVYTASMRFLCDDPGAALDLFAAKAGELGGYVAASWSDTGGGQRVESAEITLRLPAGTLDAFKEYAAGLGVIRSYNMSTDDITDDYYDLDARLAQSRLREEQVASFMEQAQTIEDTLAVYRELADIREEIEVMEGRQRMWDQQVAYSTLTVTLDATPNFTEDTPEFIRVITVSETWQRTRRGFINVARGTVNVLSWIFTLAGWLLLPAAIVGGAVWLILWLARRKRKNAVPRKP